MIKQKQLVSAMFARNATYIATCEAKGETPNVVDYDGMQVNPDIVTGIKGVLSLTDPQIEVLNSFDLGKGFLTAIKGVNVKSIMTFPAVFAFIAARDYNVLLRAGGVRTATRALLGVALCGATNMGGVKFAVTGSGGDENTSDSVAIARVRKVLGRLPATAGHSFATQFSQMCGSNGLFAHMGACVKTGKGDSATFTVNPDSPVVRALVDVVAGMTDQTIDALATVIEGEGSAS